MKYIKSQENKMIILCIKLINCLVSWIFQVEYPTNYSILKNN